MTVIGIDPGQKGGIAFVTDFLCNAVPLPMLGKDVDIHELRSILLEYKPDLVVIEHQAGRFSTPYSYGMILGCCLCMMCKVETVTPNKWQSKILGRVEKGATKGEVLAFCQKYFADVDLRLGVERRKPHDGMADALALAEYGRRFVLGAA